MLISAMIVSAIVLWAVAITRWFRARNTPGQRAFTHALVALAVAATIYITPVAMWIDSVVGINHLSSAMIFAAGAFAALAMLAALRHMTMPTEAARAGALIRRVAVSIAVVGLVLALLVGQPATATVSLVWGSESLGWMIAFWALWVGFVIWASAHLSYLAARSARSVAPSRLRSSLNMLAVGLLALGVYGVSKGILIGATIFGGTLPAVTLLSTVAAFAFLLLLAASSGIILVGRIPAVRAAQDWKAIETIRPLWEHLSVVDPEIAMRALPYKRPKKPVEIEYALYRMTIEIRDWLRQLKQIPGGRAYADSLGIPPAASDVDSEVAVLVAAARVFTSSIDGGQAFDLASVLDHGRDSAKTFG